ncbi:MAG TPA: sigma-54 dependent transcriptional regulator [Terriglobales bacterium]
MTLLVVSRDSSLGNGLWDLAELNHWHLETAGSGCEALERVQADPAPGLVLIDLVSGDTDGIYALRWLRRIRPSTPVILLAPQEDARQRAEAMRLGASEYLIKPVAPRQLEAALHRHLDGDADGMGPHAMADEPLILDQDDRCFLAASQVMRKLRAQAELLAHADVPLLIVGEAGSGKETTARVIHKLSVRSDFPFIKVTCSALPPDLLEKELFGYRPNSLSGASGGHPGKFKMAEKGTVLLDDVANLPSSLQARLLSLLQERRHSYQNGSSGIQADVRIMAAMTGDLEQALSKGRLREDLYYQLSAFTVHVPPLRQRKEEIPLLLGHFMNQLAKHYGLAARGLSPELLEACRSYDWPGNLRELERFVKRYLVIGDEELALTEIRKLGITQSGESEQSRSQDGPGPAAEEEGSSGLRFLVQTVKGETEKNAIAVALEQTHWNRKAAARLLKVSYRTLLYKIQQYRMNPPAGYLSSFSGSEWKGNGHGS